MGKKGSLLYSDIQLPMATWKIEKVLRILMGLAVEISRQKEQERANCLVLIMINYKKKDEIKKKLLSVLFNFRGIIIYLGLAGLDNKTIFHPQCLSVKDFQSCRWQDEILNHQ